MENFENHDKEISRLFDEARSHLEKIDNNSKQQKKQVIKDLAKSLEEKIQTDIICIEITNQLRGQVSDSFIRQSLDEKYKQKSRVENARKQEKQQTSTVNSDLAAVTTLNPTTKDKKILIDTYGRAIFEEDQNNKDEDEDDNGFTSIESSTISENVFPEIRSQKHQGGLAKEDEHRDLVKCSSCMELKLENEELKEALTKSSPLVTADKTRSSLTDQNELDVKYDQLLPFAFYMLYDDLRKQMQSIFPNVCSYSKIWFNGKIDRSTGEVVSSSFNGLNPHK
jgi:hypothetical protein